MKPDSGRAPEVWALYGAFASFVFYGLAGLLPGALYGSAFALHMNWVTGIGGRNVPAYRNPIIWAIAGALIALLFQQNFGFGALCASTIALAMNHFFSTDEVEAS